MSDLFIDSKNSLNLVLKDEDLHKTKMHNGYEYYYYGKSTAKINKCEKIAALIGKILLAILGCGFPGISPRFRKWIQQTVKQLKVGYQTKEVYVLKTPITKELLGLNNSKIHGQIHGVYITTNETGTEETYEFLKKQPVSPGKSIHIGCAGWYNFDIMCERKSNFGLIVDFNPANADFIKETLTIVKASSSRQAFVQKMNSYLKGLKGEQKAVIFHKDQKESPISKIEKELSRKGSWLSSEERFQFIRGLAEQSRIVAITEDYTNRQKFSAIAKLLQKNDTTIDTVYLSNICNFMQSDPDKNNFAQSIKQIVQDNTILINCPKLIQTSTILHQKCTVGVSTRKLFES